MPFDRECKKGINRHVDRAPVRAEEEGRMFVACSTLCFAREPLETALRLIAELEFDKFELALVEDGQHLRPSEAGDNPEAALQRLRSGPSLIRRPFTSISARSTGPIP